VRGVLLDPRTGRPEGTAEVPRSSEVDDWARRVERRLFNERTGKLLRGSDAYRATTTTRAYKAHPAAAAGISRATLATPAWGNSTWTEVVAANAITSTFYIAGVTWMWHTPLAVVDTTYEFEICLGTGAGGSEVEVIVIPASVRSDTAVGQMSSNFYPLPEPKEVAANTRIAVRLRYSVAASVTLTGIKILYSV